MIDDPLATIAAKTNATEALRSLDINSAALKLVLPKIKPYFFNYNFSTSLLNSATCINLFSKILSVMELLPFALHRSTMNCACKSVGKSGYSLVTKLLMFLIFLDLLYEFVFYLFLF